MSSIVGPYLVSMLPMTILSMDAAIVSRYMDLVESSRMILLALILEILDVILPTGDTSVGIFPPGRAGPDVFILVVVSTKLGLLQKIALLPVCWKAGMLVWKEFLTSG